MSFVPRLPTILVADDNPDEVLLTERALRKAGLKNPIVSVGGGAAAIDYLRASCLAAGGTRMRKPAVLIVDLKMPAIDGFKVIRWARRKRAFKKLRIFVLTNSDQPRDLALAKQLRVDGYLVKYPNSSVLQWVMNQALAPRPRRGPPAEPFIATEAPLPGA